MCFPLRFSYTRANRTTNKHCSSHYHHTIWYHIYPYSYIPPPIACPYAYLLLLFTELTFPQTHPFKHLPPLTHSYIFTLSISLYSNLLFSALIWNPHSHANRLIQTPTRLPLKFNAFLPIHLLPSLSAHSSHFPVTCVSLISLHRPMI